jgi:hypothetical protein
MRKKPIFFLNGKFVDAGLRECARTDGRPVSEG